jgi:hypothetical protein
MMVMALAYLEHGRWPVWHYVQSELDRKGMDANEVIKSLPRVGGQGLIGRSYGLAWFDRMLANDSRPALTVAASLHIQELRPEIGDPFIRVLRFMVDRQLNAPVSPHEVKQVSVHSSEVQEAMPDLSEDILIQMREVLEHEPAVTGSSGWSGHEGILDWTRYLEREILKYREINSVEEYVDRVGGIIRTDLVETQLWGMARRGSEDEDDGVSSREPTESISVQPKPSVTPSYVKESLIEELRHKAASTTWNLDKLLKLIEELNSNYAVGNAYASHALLRAILDHTPPAFSHRNFDEVANNHPWSRTDKAYLKNLRDFRNTADDVLHRQLRASADIITLHDMPPRAYVNAFVRGLIDTLSVDQGQ